MTDPIAVLRRAAEEAGAQAREPDPVAAVRARADRRRRSRHRAWIGAAAAVVALLVGVVAVVASRGDDREGVVVSPSTVTEPTTEPPVEGATTTDPAPASATADPPPRSPLSRRRAPAVAVVGGAIVVWGGTDGAGQPLDDGAVYDMATHGWTMLAPSPLAGRPDEGQPPVAAGVGSGVVVARGRSIARWNRDGTWSARDDAPGTITDATSFGGYVASAGANAVLDNESPAWLPADEPPVAVDPRTAVPAGGTLVVVGRVGDEVVALVLDTLAHTWSQAPSAPAGLLGDGDLAAAGDGATVVVTSTDRRAARFDPARGTWSELPDVPARADEAPPAMASIGGLTAVATPHALVVLDGDRWLPLPSPVTGTARPVGITGTTIATWVDDAGPGEPDLVLTDLVGARGPAPRLQVGPATVALAPGDEVDDARRDRASDAVTLDLTAGEGGSCTVTSALGGPRGTAAQRAVEEELALADGAKAWFHDEAGRHWETEIGDQDLVTVECDEPDAARRLALTLRLG